MRGEVGIGANVWVFGRSCGFAFAIGICDLGKICEETSRAVLKLRFCICDWPFVTAKNYIRGNFVCFSFCSWHPITFLRVCVNEYFLCGDHFLFLDAIVYEVCSFQRFTRFWICCRLIVVTLVWSLLKFCWADVSCVLLHWWVMGWCIVCIIALVSNGL